MKKRILILFLCFIMLFITSCSNETVVPANTSTTPSPTANTTDDLTFNLDKVCFKWLNGQMKEKTLWSLISRLDGYYEKEEGRGYFNSKESIENAFTMYKTEYYHGYNFQIVYNGEFEESMLGKMSTYVSSRSDNEISVYFNIHDEKIDREHELDVEKIKEISNLPNVEYIVFYYVDSPFSQPGTWTTEIPTEIPDEYFVLGE